MVYGEEGAGGGAVARLAQAGITGERRRGMAINLSRLDTPYRYSLTYVHRQGRFNLTAFSSATRDPVRAHLFAVSCSSGSAFSDSPEAIRRPLSRQALPPALFGPFRRVSPLLSP